MILILYKLKPPIIKTKEQNLIALNTGRLSIERQPAETEEDYLQRLNKIG